MGHFGSSLETNDFFAVLLALVLWGMIPGSAGGGPLMIPALLVLLSIGLAWVLFWGAPSTSIAFYYSEPGQLLSFNPAP